jgi:gas vesicle protein
MMEDREERGMSFLTFLAGAGIGALIGAAAALLLAPQSGSESRESVKEALGKLADRTEQLAGRVKDATTGFVQAKREKVSQAVSAYREGKAEVKEESE